MNSLKRRIVGGTVVTFVMRLLGIAIVLLLHKLLSMRMTRGEYGNYLLGIDIALFLSLAGSGGLNPGVVRILAGRTTTLTASLTRTLVARSAILLVLICAAVSVMAYLLLRYLLCDWLNWPQRIVISSVICGALVAVHRYLSGVFRGTHLAGWSAALDGRSGGPLVMALYTLLIFLPPWFVDTSNATNALWILTASLLVTIPAVLFVLFRLIDRAFPPTADDLPSDQSTHLADIFWISIPFVGSQLVNFVSLEMDFFIAKSILPEDDASLLGAARRLVVNFQVPTQILMLSTISTVAELHAKKRLAELQRVVQSAAMIAFLVTFPLIALSLFFRESLLEFVYTPQYRSAGTIFAILAVGQIINLLSGHAGQALGMAGKTHTVTIISLIACGLMLLIGTWVARRYGLVALAVASTCITSLQYIALWLIVRIQVGVWTHPFLHIEYMRNRNPTRAAK